MGRDAGRRKKSPVTVRGAWFPLSGDFLRSRVFAELSPLAVKLLFTLCGQLGYNAKGNGDLSAAPAIVGPQGWRSKASLTAALAELEDVGVLCVTRRGGRKLCTLYAITLWPMDCNFAKLDHGPGAYATESWRLDSAKSDKPSEGHPATWNRPRKNAIGAPATGEGRPDMPPLGGNMGDERASFAPATGTKAPKKARRVPPPRDTYLDIPSAQASAGQGVGQASTRNPMTRLTLTEAAFERVRECELSPDRYDPTTGECLPSELGPAKANKRHAAAWVSAAMGKAGKQAPV